MRGKLAAGLMLLWGAVPALAAPPTFSTQRVVSSQADLCFDVRTDDVYASYDALIAWWENNGANPPGLWTKHVVTVFADGAHAVFPAQVDGDSDPDFLTATFNTSEVMWFENGSLPNPWEEHPISFNAPFADDVWGADMDGDGDTDALVSYYPKISWYESDGASTPVFFAEHLLTQQSGADAVQAADLDRDGDMDVVSATWYENDGATDPVFTPRVVSPTGGAVSSVVVIDVDRGGDPDIPGRRMRGSPGRRTTEARLPRGRTTWSPPRCCSRWRCTRRTSTGTRRGPPLRLLRRRPDRLVRERRRVPAQLHRAHDHHGGLVCPGGPCRGRGPRRRHGRPLRHAAGSRHRVVRERGHPDRGRARSTTSCGDRSGRCRWDPAPARPASCRPAPQPACRRARRPHRGRGSTTSSARETPAEWAPTGSPPRVPSV